MATARRSLPSVFHLDGGVSSPQVVPSYTPIAPTAGSGLACLLPAPPLFRRYALRFRDGTFLHGYSDDGISCCASLERAKVFLVAPEIAANILGGEIIPILCQATGKNKRRCLRRPKLTVAVKSSRGKEIRELKEVGALTKTADEGIGRRIPLVHDVQSGKELFRAFIAAFLNATIPVNFLQAGHLSIPDQILFEGPHHSHLCVPVSTLLLPMEEARALVRAKVTATEKAFGVNS